MKHSSAAIAKAKKPKSVKKKTAIARKRKVTKRKSTESVKKKTLTTTKKNPKINEIVSDELTESKKVHETPKKRFLSDVKQQRKPRRKKQLPLEAIDNSSYLFEKVTNKKRGRRKFIKPIGSAVFRGNRLAYEFDSYDLKGRFEDFPAVFVISMRKIDKFGKGHHKIICIGQTEALGTEMAKLQKLSAVKKNKGNVVSILKDESEKELRRIAENLKLRYKVLCSHE